MKSIAKITGLTAIFVALSFSSAWATNLYVGNIPWTLTEQELKTLFEPYGMVESANIVYDKNNGRSKGHGFVQMIASDEADAAIAALNGTQLQGQTIVVSATGGVTPSGRAGNSRIGNPATKKGKVGVTGAAGRRGQ